MRNAKIDALRGIAIFLVILGHSIIVFPVNLHEVSFYKTIFDLISTIHMPLFFIVSGYCFSTNSNIKDFLTKKIKRLLLPYFTFNLIELLFRSFFSDFVNKQIDIWFYIKSMFLYGGEYWFLYSLFLMLLLFYSINKNINNKIFDAITLFVFLVLNLLGIQINALCLNSLCIYGVYFELGLLIRKYKLIDAFSNINIMVLLISFVAWISLFCFVKNYESTIIELLMVISGLVFINQLTNFNFIVSLFNDIGKYSLQLYLLNGFLLVFSRTIICKLTNNPFIIIIFNVLINYYVSYLIIKYILCRSKRIRFFIGA